MTPWWRSDAMIGVMWAFICFLGSIVGYFFKEWRKDRRVIIDLREDLREIQRELAVFKNGSSMAVIVAKVKDIHDWWMDRIKKA